MITVTVKQAAIELNISESDLRALLQPYYKTYKTIKRVNREYISEIQAYRDINDFEDNVMSEVPEISKQVAKPINGTNVTAYTETEDTLYKNHRVIIHDHSMPGINYQFVTVAILPRFGNESRIILRYRSYREAIKEYKQFITDKITNEQNQIIASERRLINTTLQAS